MTQDNRLVTFQSDNVTNVEPSRPITGLPGGEGIAGLDVRPLNGQLYALGTTSRVYVINPRTGAARQVGATPFIPALAGTNFGFDFNPTVDRIRVTSDAEQNLRLNPDDGAVAGVDANLAYRIDLSNGHATKATNFFIGTDQRLVGLAAAGTIADDTTAPDESIALSSTQLRERLLGVGVRMSVACDEACNATAAVTYAGRSSGLNGAVVAGGPGRATLTVALNQRTRDAIRRTNVRLTVRITVIDGAGNRSRQTRVLRSQTLDQRRG